MVSFFSFLVIAVAFTLSGSATVLFNKLLYQTKAEGIKGDFVYYNKPWFSEWLMFIGELFVFVVYWINLCYSKQKKKRFNQNETLLDPLLGPIKNEKSVVKTWKVLLYVYLAMVFDLASGMCCNLALMWVSASISQILRGSVIIFLAILTIFYRKRRLYRNEWIGVALVTLSIVILGAVVLLNQLTTSSDSADPKHSALLSSLGVVVSLVGMCIQAFLGVYEERLLHDIDIPALKFVSYEGLFGVLTIALVFFPICYFLPGEEGYAFHENTLDTFVLLRHSWFASLCAAGFALSCFFFNALYLILINITNALTSNILQQLRNLLIWVVSLFIFYVIDTDYGEAWTNWSFLELGGFALMVAGIFIYQGVFKFKFLMGNEVRPDAGTKKNPTQMEEKKIEEPFTDSDDARAIEDGARPILNINISSSSSSPPSSQTNMVTNDGNGSSNLGKDDGNSCDSSSEPPVAIVLKDGGGGGGGDDDSGNGSGSGSGDGSGSYYNGVDRFLVGDGDGEDGLQD